MLRNSLLLVAVVALCAAGCKKKEAAPGQGGAAVTGKPGAGSAPTTQPSAVKAQTAASPEVRAGEATKCPVSGETFTVDAKSPFSMHQGKKIYFCCDKCKAPFEKDPAKYLNKT